MSWWLWLALAAADPVDDWRALMDTGRFDEAAALAEAQAEAEAGDLTDHLHWLRSAVSANLQAGSPKRALELAETLLAAVDPTEPFDVAAALQVRGLARSQLGRFAEARADQERALVQLAQMTTPDAPLQSSVRIQLAWSLEQLGELEAAETQLATLLSTDELDDARRSEALANHSSVLTTLGRLEEAQTQLEEALRIKRAQVGPRHPHALLLLNNLAGIHRSRGDLVAAQAAYEQVRTGLVEVLPPEHPYHAGIANNLAQVLGSLGRAEEALDMLEAALAGWRQALGPEHPNVAATLTNLASAHRALGDVGRARDALLQAVAINEATHGPEHPATAFTWMHLAHLSVSEDAFDQAAEELTHARQALAAVDPVNVAWADLLELEARVARRTGRYAEALAKLEESDAIWTALGGKSHPGRWECLLEQARSARAMGLGELALSRARESLALARSSYAIRNTHHLNSQLEIVHALEATGRSAEAMEAARLAWGETRQHLAALARRASHRRWLSASRQARLLYSVLLERVEDPVEAWQISLEAREISRRSALWTRERAAARDDPEATRLVGRLHAARAAWTEAAWSPLETDDTAAARQAHLDMLDQEVRSLEVALVSRTAVSLEPRRVAGQDELCRALGPDEVLVDLLLLPSTVEEGGGGLLSGLAFVLRGGDCASGPERVPLGELSDLADDIDHYRSLLTQPEALTARVDDVGRRLRARLWDPVAPLVEGAERVWVVADGELASLSLAALPLADGRYLLEEHEVAYLESPLDLLPPERPPPAEKVVVVGGVSYSSAQDADKRSIAPCSLSYPQLPGTLVEAVQIGKLWEGRAPVTSLLGAAGTEHAVQTHASEARVLQLATHGFFVNQACPQHPRDPSSLWASGVVLADLGSPGDDDGLWTTAEVAGLDLQRTELVVLSACESGRGRASAMGTLGLRRAFAMAGARHLVMSLWAVPDAPTAELMVQMHRRLAARRPPPVATALREAQLMELRANRRRYGEGRPGAWGAFVVSGR